MLIERQGPLEILSAMGQRAAAGFGATAIVEGEAGIGKTSLLREFASNADPALKFMWGGCEALFTPRPLGPLQDMARDIAPVLGTLFEQSAAPDRLFPALLGALQEIRETSILIFEDVHWADNATLDLIKYLGRRVAFLRVLLVLSLRTDEIGADHPLAQVLGDLPSASTARVELKPLTAEGVAALAQLDRWPSDELYRITEGNPFFVTELLARNNSADGQLPASIRDAVWSRISRLTHRERELLDVISVVPGSIEPWLIHALMGDDTHDTVDQLVSRGMLVRDPQGSLKFRHELARQATLDRLAPSVQKSLHVRAEAAMSKAVSDGIAVPLSNRVHHAAGADDGRRVLDLAPQAAAQAAKLGAHQQAASHLTTALRYADQASSEIAAQLYEDWSYEAGLALRIDDSILAARQKAVALWRELGRTDKAGANLRWLSRLHWYRGESDKAEDYINQALKELEGQPPGPETAMTYSARSQLHMLHDRTDEAIEWGLQAIALAEELGEIETRVHALNNVGSALLFSGREGGRARIEESLALALEHGFHEQAARAYTNFAEYAVLFKEFALAERILSEGIAFDTQHDLDAWTHYLIGRQAQLRMEQGRLREAETIAKGVMSLERLTLVMRLPALTVLGKVRTRLGKTDGVELLQKALQDALATGEPQNITPVRLALVEAAWLAEDMTACQAHLADLATIDLKNTDPWEMGDISVWWRRSGMTQAFPVAEPRIALPRSLELSGRYAEASAEWTRLGVPYEAAMTLLLVTGSETGSSLNRAVSMFETIESRAAASMARRKAKLLGVDALLPKARRGPYAAARTHPLGLTKRELEVLDLIARGMGNLDIAKYLDRSPRTVEHHVSTMLGKLNANSRIDVMLRLRSEPWLLGSASRMAEAKI